MPGFATSTRTLEQAHRLMQALGCQAHELDIRPSALPDAERHRPPLRRRAAGVRRDLRERPGRRAHQPPLPAGQPPPRAGGRDRRSQRAGPRLVHLRGGRPHVALQRQRQRPQDADPARHPLGRRHRPAGRRDQRGPAAHSGRPRSARSSCLAISTAASPRQSTEAIIGPYELQDFNLYYTLRFGFAPPRWPSWPTAPGTTCRPASGPRSPPTAATSTGSTRSRPTSSIFLRRFFQLSQFKRSCIPNAPKVGSGRLALPPRRLPRPQRRRSRRLAPAARADSGPGVARPRPRLDLAQGVLPCAFRSGRTKYASV